MPGLLPQELDMTDREKAALWDKALLGIFVLFWTVPVVLAVMGAW